MIELYIRFEGWTGEQHIMLLLDPAGTRPGVQGFCRRLSKIWYFTIAVGGR